MPTRHADGADASGPERLLFRTVCALSPAVVVLLAGCAQPGLSGTSAPTAFDSTPDPYHYHCDDACRNAVD